MASRRKSTTPCMVPPQRQHHHPVDSDPEMEVVAEGDEEEDGGGDRLSTRLSPPDSRGSDERPPASSDHYVKTAADCGGGSEGGGGYECKYCSFRTAALNLFTLHVDGEHPDVVLNSAYVCVACDFRTRRYDALQEHNARHHPGEDGFTRTMVRRQNHTVFEQTVNDLTFAGGFVKMEDGGEEEEEEEEEKMASSCKGIAFSKTPIMKIKSRAEAKKFPAATKMAAIDVIKVESDGEMEDSEEADLGGSGSAPPPPIAPAPALVTAPPAAIQTLPQGIVLNSSNLLQFKTGAGSTTTAMLPPGTLAQVLSALQNQQNLQQNQNQNQQQSHTHQLLIPLSSIPTYSAAMDSNVLLVGAYNRFPYPSVPEIAALAAQTKFGEEQIRVWFSAQRLKRGVSWTPEEVDEARRKKFNGAVVQPGGVGGHQTITVIPASSLAAAAAAANGLQSIFQTCQIVGQPGLVLTQVGGGGGGGGGGSPLTLTVAGVTGGHQQAKAAKSEPPAAAAATAETNATHSPDPQGTKPKKSKEQLAELKASYTRRQFATEAEISRLMRVTNLTKRAIKKWFSDTRYNQRSARDHDQRARDLLLAGGPLGGGVADGNGGLLLLDDIDGAAAGPNATIVIDSSDDAAGEFSPSAASFAARHETTPPSAAGAAAGTPRTPPTPSSSSSSSDPRVKFRNAFPDFTPQRFKEKTAEQLTALEASFLRSATPSDDELTRLRSATKLTRREVDAWFTERRKSLDAEADAAGAEGGPTPPAAAAAAGGRKVTKKTPEQLHALKSAFVRSQWPAADEYDKMADDTGLPRNYIVNWFGDTRYAAKNSTLKWFYQYQGGAAAVAPDQNGASGGGKHKKPRKRFRGWSRRTRRPCPPCKRPHPPAAASAARPPAAAAPGTARGGRRFLREHYLRHGALGEKDLDELVSKSSMSYEQVRAWFSGVVSRVGRGLPPFEEGGEGEGEEQAEVQGGEARPRESEGEMEVKEQGEEEERHEEEEDEEEGRRHDEEDRRGDEEGEAEEEGGDGGEHREEQPRTASQPVEEEEEQP